MYFAAAASILGVKNLSPTQTQAIGYTNIPSDLPLVLGLCISLVVYKNHFKIGLLVITMVKYVFCCSSFNSLSKKTSLTQIQAIGYTNIPSDLHLALGVSISLVVHKNHVKIRQLVITMVKYVFFCNTLNSYSNKPVTHTNPS